MAQAEYKDSFPEDLPSIEAVLEKYATVVWCRYKHCTYNEEVPGLVRTTKSVSRLRTYEPLSPIEDKWRGLCNRREIAIDYKEVTTSTGLKQKVPLCFTATSGVTGHLDMTRFLHPQMERVSPPVDPGAAFI